MTLGISARRALNAASYSRQIMLVAEDNGCSPSWSLLFSVDEFDLAGTRAGCSVSAGTGDHG